MLGCHPSPSGVTGIRVTLLVSLSGYFLLLRLVLGAAGSGLPLQPVAQHAEFWGRGSPATAPQFWGTGAVPWLCVLLGALLTAAAEKKDRCRSNTPRLLLLAPRPAPLRPHPSCLSQSLTVCLTHRPVDPRARPPPFLTRIAGLVPCWGRARACLLWSGTVGAEPPVFVRTG